MIIYLKNKNYFKMCDNTNLYSLDEEADKLCSIIYEKLEEVIDSPIEKEQKLKVVQTICDIFKNLLDNYNEEIKKLTLELEEKN